MSAVKLVRRGLMAVVMLLDAVDDVCSAVEVTGESAAQSTYCAVSSCYVAAPIWVRTQYWVCDGCMHSKQVRA